MMHGPANVKPTSNDRSYLERVTVWGFVLCDCLRLFTVWLFEALYCTVWLFEALYCVTVWGFVLCDCLRLCTVLCDRLRLRTVWLFEALYCVTVWGFVLYCVTVWGFVLCDCLRLCTKGCWHFCQKKWVLMFMILLRLSRKNFCIIIEIGHNRFLQGIYK